MKVVPQGAKILLRLAGGVENCYVRTVDLKLLSAHTIEAPFRINSHLVPRKGIEIHPQCLDVNFPVRRQRHPIHA